jgi:hypothetical protein
MSFAIFLNSRPIGWPSVFDYRYVRTYEPSAPADDFAQILTVTDDPAQAMQFPTQQAAIDKYVESVGMRQDGEPDRPLTEWSIEVREVANETTTAGR